jgi:hypothetical protein
MSKITIPRACKNCAYCYNKEYCLINEQYIDDLKNQECDEKISGKELRDGEKYKHEED